MESKLKKELKGVVELELGMVGSKKVVFVVEKPKNGTKETQKRTWFERDNEARVVLELAEAYIQQNYQVYFK